MALDARPEILSKISRAVNVPLISSKEETKTLSLKWNNRHSFPSAKSGYILPQNTLSRLSLIRDQGLYINVRTNLDLVTGNVFPFHKKRYYDALLDWEIINELQNRNTFLIKQAELEERTKVADVLRMNYTSVITDPEDLVGWNGLSPQDQIFLRVILIYSGVPDTNEVIRDLILLDGIGEVKARKMVSNNKFLYEDENDSCVLLFRPNRNHVNSFRVLFEAACRTIVKDDFDVESKMIVAGSFGRGATNGHDLDILFHEKDRETVLTVLRLISHKVLITDKSYVLVILDTLVRIDVNFYTDENKLTYMFHFFGPVEMNVIMRKKAKDNGYILSQNGLYRVKDSKYIHPQSDIELFELIGIEKDPRKTYWK